jgi:hypothetical protein
MKHRVRVPEYAKANSMSPTHTGGRFLWSAVRNSGFVFDQVSVDTIKAKGITFEPVFSGVGNPGSAGLKNPYAYCRFPHLVRLASYGGHARAHDHQRLAGSALARPERRNAISELMIRRPCPAPNAWSNGLVDTHPERLNARMATTRHKLIFQ